MMLRCICALVFGCSWVSASVAAETTWFKRGIDYEAYKRDALECGKLGYFRDVSHDEPAKQFIRGFQTADDNLNKSGGNDSAQAGEDWSNTIRRTQPSRKMKQVHEIQVSDVEQCLIKLGYGRYNLSKAEARALARLRRGSEQRRRFLYSLGRERGAE